MTVTDETAPAAVARRMLIDGRLTEGTTHVRRRSTRRPATWSATRPTPRPQDANAAVAAARRAFDTTGWATDTALRIRCLDQLYQALRDNLEELRELTIAEVGSPRQLTHANQLEVPIEIVRYYAGLLDGYPLTEELAETEFARPAAPPLGGEGGRRGGGRDHPVQLPQPDRPGQAGARAGRGLHGGAQGRARTRR